MPINILALVYGGLMIINIGIWSDPMFGDFGGEGRDFTNPGFGLFFTPFGNAIEGLPDIPMFELIVAVLVVTGAIYYALQVRGRVADVEADTATGEVVIG